jgi:hypothetical protein
VGKLAIGRDGFRLVGASPGLDVDVSVERDEIASVGLARTAAARLDGRPTVVITLKDGHVVRLTCIDGPGAVHEVARRMTQLATVSTSLGA